MTMYSGQLNLVMDPYVHTSPLLKCNFVCICLHVACFSIWVAHHFTQNWNATEQFFFDIPLQPEMVSHWLYNSITYIMFLSGSVCRSNPPITLCSSSSVTCQSEPSVFVMVEDNQFQNKENQMVERRQAERRRRRGERKEALMVTSRRPLP